MKMTKYLMLVACAGFLAGCAAVVPMELTKARQAYQHANAGLAAQLVPAELYKAEQALGRAEASFLKDSDSFQTKDLAYVAERKAMMADALAFIASRKRDAAQANRDYQSSQSEIIAKTKADLSRTQAEKSQAATAAEAAALAVQQQARFDTQKRVADRAAADAAAKFDAEQQARREAEQRTAVAQAQLAKVAQLKEEARGLVITLSGSVVFASNQATILPAAQSRLNQVAEALMSTDRNRMLIVEGHTDSQGAAAYNMDLSQRRAESVRDYLISCGYPAQFIAPRGIGEVRPIADNASPEGRSNNRRVEIIVQPGTNQ
jgi:outer membrane protein OmpA-like peptidoglycan-associated protein